MRTTKTLKASAAHVWEKYTFTEEEFTASYNKYDNNWSISHPVLGCSKGRDTPEEALRNVLYEHGCTDIVLIDVKELKIQKRYAEAGAMAYREDRPAKLGQHFGMRQDYKKAEAEFKKGWEAERQRHLTDKNEAAITETSTTQKGTNTMETKDINKALIRFTKAGKVHAEEKVNVVYLPLAELLIAETVNEAKPFPTPRS